MKFCGEIALVVAPCDTVPEKVPSEFSVMVAKIRFGSAIRVSVMDVPLSDVSGRSYVMSDGGSSISSVIDEVSGRSIEPPSSTLKRYDVAVAGLCHLN